MERNGGAAFDIRVELTRDAVVPGEAEGSRREPATGVSEARSSTTCGCVSNWHSSCWPLHIAAQQRR